MSLDRMIGIRSRMARPYPKLSKLSDSGGQQLWIQPNGSRLWRLAYRYAGKQKILALGTYPTASLSDAGQARDEAKKVLAAGGDPAVEKKLRKAESVGTTFREISTEYMERKREGCSDSTITRDKRLLDAADPLLGNVPIRAINAPMVHKALRKVGAGTLRIGETNASHNRRGVALCNRYRASGDRPD